MRLRARLLLVLLLPVLLLAGCAARLAYKQLDWLVPWYVGDYVTLDREQKRLLDARLAQRLAWHCSSQLGPYGGLLRDLERRLNEGTPLAATELEHYLQRGETFWRVLMTAITPDARLLLAGLSDAQVEELAAAFVERNKEAREKFLDGTADELHARQIERMEKRLKTWFGRLQPNQRTLVAAWSASLVPTTEQWLRNREQWQGELLAALARRERPEFEVRLAGLLVTPTIGWPEHYQTDVARNQALTLSLLADTFNTASPTQRRHLLGEVSSWAGQFEQLACAAPASAAGAG
ncbi:MAG: DUF6279 family lipoprotein [Azoarcus sp.]|nr:DUF6279 family lipoprotein [Azoarcus sp.]